MRQGEASLKLGQGHGMAAEKQCCESCGGDAPEGR